MSGGSTGGTVVESENPFNAFSAAHLGAQGAYNADQLYNQMATQGLASLQKSYADSLSSLQPATSEGINALDSLNKLLGLPAYNPTAPTAPTQPTLQNLESQISPAQIQQYVQANTMPFTNPQGGWFGYYDYTGAGSDIPSVSGPLQTHGDASGIGINNITRNPNTIANNSGYASAIAQTLAQQQLPAANQLYNAQNQVYNQQKALYDQAQQLAQNYQPLTPQQIQDQLSQTPGYQCQLGQGLQAVQNQASAKGLSNSGNALEALAAYANGLASQTFGQRVQDLAGLVGQGNQASSQAANLAGNLGNNSASLYQGMGTQAANSQLAATQSLMQGLLTSGQQFNVIGQQQQSGLGGIGQLLGSLGGLFGGGGGSAGGGAGLAGLIGGLL